MFNYKIILSKKIWTTIFFALTICQDSKAGPLANKFDPFCNPAGSGMDPYPALYDEAERGRWNLSFDLSPYYQDSDSGRNWAGEGQYQPSGQTTLANVGILEEHGAWNILGIGYGVSDEIFFPGDRIPAPSTGDPTLPENVATKPNDFLPIGSNFTASETFETTKLPAHGGTKIKALLADGGARWTYKNYQNLINALHAIAFTPANSTVPNVDSHTQGTDGCSYRVTGKPAVSDRFSKIFVPTDTSFDDANYRTETYGFYRPQAQFRRYGVRVKGSITFMPGFKIWAKGGVCEYKVRPIPFAGAEPGVRSEMILARNEAISDQAEPLNLEAETGPRKRGSKKQSSKEAQSRSNLKPDAYSENGQNAVLEAAITMKNKLDKLTEENRDQKAKIEELTKKNEIIRSMPEIGSEPTRATSFGSAEISAEPTRTTSLGTTDKAVIETNFLNPTSVRQILDELGFAMEPYSELTLEDTYVATDFAYPIIFKGKGGYDAVKVWPTASLGIWFPTSKHKKRRNTENLFRIPMGNDGHTGFSIDGSINMDFIGSITANFGVSATFFDRRTIDKYPIKINPFQRGIKPWLVQVSRRLGETYAAHASMAAVNFIDGLTAYAEYTIVSHRKDKVKILNVDLKKVIADDDLMTDAFDDQIRETAWSLHELHCGLSYQVTQNLELGAAFKAHVAGESVPRVKSVMVSMKIAF